MRKIRLEMDALRVESFAMEADAHAGRGTVRGRDESFGGMGCRSNDGTECQTYEGGTSCASGGQLCVCACDPTPNCV